MGRSNKGEAEEAVKGLLITRRSAHELAAYREGWQDAILALKTMVRDLLNARDLEKRLAGSLARFEFGERAGDGKERSP